LPSGTAPNNDGGDKFEKVDTGASRTPSSAMSISSAAPPKMEPAEYKMSVVNDSGVYLPPSPPEKKSFWPKRSNPSTTSTASRSSIAENEPFSISRESFDSYRRSFDISARSPVTSSYDHYPKGRRSLDAIPQLPRSAFKETKFERQPPTAEEAFEEVGLNDENKQQPTQSKRKSFFSKFGEEQTPPQTPTTAAPLTSRFHLPGRKRGQSGQGAELGEIPRPGSAATAVAPEVR